MAEAVKHYDPEREFLALILDVTPTLPDPQTWFDLFPREGLAKASELEQAHPSIQEGGTMSAALDLEPIKARLRQHHPMSSGGLMKSAPVFRMRKPGGVVMNISAVAGDGVSGRLATLWM